MSLEFREADPRAKRQADVAIFWLTTAVYSLAVHEVYVRLYVYVCVVCVCLQSSFYQLIKAEHRPIPFARLFSGYIYPSVETSWVWTVGTAIDY